MLKNYKEINKRKLRLVDESALLKQTALFCGYDKVGEVRKKQEEIYKKFKFYDGFLKAINKK